MVCLSAWFSLVVSIANARRMRVFPEERDASPQARLLGTTLKTFLFLDRPFGSVIQRRNSALSRDASTLQRIWTDGNRRTAQAPLYARRTLAKPRASNLVAMHEPNMPKDYMSSHGLLYEEWGALPMQFLNDTVTFQEAARERSFSRYDAVLIAADRANQIFMERSEEEQNDAEANGWFSRGGQRKPKPEHSDVILAIRQLMQQYMEGGIIPDPLPRGLKDDELEEVYHLMRIENVSQTEALQILSEKQDIVRRYGLTEDELEQVYYFMQEENITLAQAVQVLQQLKVDAAHHDESIAAIQEEYQDSIESASDDFTPLRAENDNDDLDGLDFEAFTTQKDGTKIQQTSGSDASLDLLLKALAGGRDEEFEEEEGEENLEPLTASKSATVSSHDGGDTRDAASHSNEHQPQAVQRLALSKMQAVQRLALSKMRKADLIAELSSYSLDTSGTVQTLRSRLKAARESE